MANQPRLEAKRFRRLLKLHPDVQLSPNQVYDLTLAETESVEAAEEAMRLMVHAMLRAGLTPEFS